MAALVYALLISLVSIIVPVRATTYLVGDSSGWNPTTDFNVWVSGKEFTVGDILVFNYGPTHSVNVVTQNDYDNCNSGNPISSHSGGKTTITLDNTGPAYFICPTPGHCQAGMKLFINTNVAGTYPHRHRSPPIGGFPSPIGGFNGPPSPPSGFPSPVDGFHGPPSPPSGFPIGGTYGYGGGGQIYYTGKANGKMNTGLAIWFSLAVAALVGVMVC